MCSLYACGGGGGGGWVWVWLVCIVGVVCVWSSVCVVCMHVVGDVCGLCVCVSLSV